MGEAFFSLTDARRHTILRQTSPSFTFMLSNTSYFNDDEAEDLFGKSLVKEMRKSADTVKKLASLVQPDRDGGNNRSTEQHGHGDTFSSGYNQGAPGCGLNPGGSGPSYNGATSSYRGRGNFDRTNGSHGGYYGSHGGYYGSQGGYNGSQDGYPSFDDNRPGYFQGRGEGNAGFSSNNRGRYVPLFDLLPRFFAISS